MLCSNLVGRKGTPNSRSPKVFENDVHRPCVWVNSAGEANDAGPDRPESGRKFQPMVPVACDEPTFSPNEIYGMSGLREPRPHSTLMPGLNHLGPLIGLVSDEFCELVGREWHWLNAKFDKTSLRLRISKGGFRRIA